MDNHLVRTPSGEVWSKGIYDYSFFSRYLDGFDEVYVTIRISDVDENHTGFTNLCSGPNVTFLPLPDFIGVEGYLKNIIKVKRLISKYCKMVDAVIVRLPSAIGYQFVNHIDGKKPYALEVVIDPWDYAAPGMIKSKFRAAIRLVWTYNLKKYCLRANGVSYVTQFSLQNRYPCKARMGYSDQYFESYYSSANIKEDFYMPPKVYKEDQEHFEFIHISNAINSYVKGHKEAILVIKYLREKGYNVSIVFVGDGEMIPEFERFAEDNEVSDHVRFVGRISDRNQMKKTLRNSDICILPTHGEGLPRVLIEAMAVGVPCLATNVNGIPELLSDNQMAEVGNYEQLSQIAERMISDIGELNQLSVMSVKKAM